MKKKEAKSLLSRIRQRYKVMKEADQENRRDALDDLEFATVAGAQWDERLKKERGERPCYEFNKIRITGKRIINAMRANRAQGKVRGVEDNDKETAETVEGLIRNIWNISDGDSVIDHAAEYQVFAGLGAWRVSTKYSSDDAFNQDIIVEPIENPFCLYVDPACKDMLKRDAEDWILTERISKNSYKERWPGAKVVEFDSDEFDDDEEWEDDETVRIAEYWYKEPAEKEIYLLSDGRTVDNLTGIDPAIITRSRIVRYHKIMQVIASGDAILEGPTEWAGSQFPFVMVYGEYVVVDGKKYWYGIVRHSKDAQRSYNVSRTAVTETIALAPKSKFWATPDQAAGHTAQWAEADKKNFPFMLYNPDPKAPGEPRRMAGADIPAALIAELNLASEEIKAVTGIFDASLGARSNEQSGRAILARKEQGDIATFNFQDNMAKGIRRTWEILIDLIPKVYDTERSIRVLGSDGAEKYVKVNQVVIDPATGEPVTVNDLSRGKFDVAITVGPSFTTRRQEAAETYLQLVQANPAVFPIAGDLIFKSMDLPYSEDIADRFRAVLPPQIQQMLNEGTAQIPPEVQAAMAQAQQAMMQVEQAAQLVQQEKMEVDKGKSELEKMVADLKTQEAQFQAQVAKEMARIAERQAKVAITEANKQSEIDQAAVAQGIAQIGAEIQSAIMQIQQLSQGFMQQAVGVLNEIQSRKQPKVARVVSRRVNGQLEAIPVYEE